MKQRVVHYAFMANLFFLALTGFAQMPIFKRYYIADIPGLGWLAKYYVTHYLHYLAAALFLGLLIYIIADHVLSGAARKRVSPAGAVRGIILAAVIISGAVLVIRNLAGTHFSPGFIIFLNFAHLGTVMLYLMAALYGLITGLRWTADLQTAWNQRQDSRQGLESEAD